MLASPIAEERKHALQRATDLAYRSPEVNLTPTVSALVDIYSNDPGKKYRLSAVSALYAIGDEAGMEQVRQRFEQEPSLTVQYVSVCALIDLYGPKAFGRDKDAVTLARNVLARWQEAQRLAKRRHLQMVPRVIIGPLEMIEADSLQ